MGVRDNGVRVCDITANVRNVRVYVDRKFGLKMNCWCWPRKKKKNGTHVKDMEDPIEIQPPGGDCIFIILCVDQSGE